MSFGIWNCVLNSNYRIKKVLIDLLSLEINIEFVDLIVTSEKIHFNLKQVTEK